MFIYYSIIVCLYLFIFIFSFVINKRVLFKLRALTIYQCSIDTRRNLYWSRDLGGRRAPESESFLNAYICVEPFFRKTFVLFRK